MEVIKSDIRFFRNMEKSNLLFYPYLYLTLFIYPGDLY